jgi:hypothetical protein
VLGWNVKVKRNGSLESQLCYSGLHGIYQEENGSERGRIERCIVQENWKDAANIIQV